MVILGHLMIILDHPGVILGQLGCSEVIISNPRLFLVHSEVMTVTIDTMKIKKVHWWWRYGEFWISSRSFTRI